jgi:hypothetical protein
VRPDPLIILVLPAAAAYEALLLRVLKNRLNTGGNFVPSAVLRYRGEIR